MLNVSWSPVYNHPLPDGHRFPMEKYDLLPEQLLHEGTLTDSNFFQPGKLKESDILAVHEQDYWKKLDNLQLTRMEERRSGFPQSRSLVDREIMISAGTLQAAEYALQYGIAMNIAGGTHHAFTDRAEGFCLLNDIAIAARYLLIHKKASQLLVVDLDVHQGNGTAQIFRDEKRVFTFSMHGENNYPMQKERSDLDIPLPDGMDDRPYLKLLDHHLQRNIDQVMPDFIFFQSGVDVLATDKLGRLGMTLSGCKERDSMVIRLAYDNKIPLVVSMGGGYSGNIGHIIEAHANTYRVAQDVYF